MLEKNVREEIWSSILCGIGALVATTFLVLEIVFSKNVLSLLGSILYGVSLLLFYLMNLFAHALQPKSAKKVFQILSYVFFSLFLVGSYTALFQTVGGVSSFLYFLFMSVISLVCILGCSISFQTFRKVSHLLFLGMRSTFFLVVLDFFKIVPKVGRVLFLLGLLLELMGAFFYLEGKRYFHFFFHILLLAANLFQFFAVFFYLL